MPIEYKTFAAEVKKFDDENLVVEHFISTEHKDRGGDIMRAKGMKIVGKPVVLLLHGRGPMGSEPVAKPLSIEVDEFKGQPGILARTQFFPDDVGNRLYKKVKGGFSPNWSIGYSVDDSKDIFEAGKYAGRDVTKWTLMEYSLVGVPMAPFAQTIKEFLDAADQGKQMMVPISTDGMTSIELKDLPAYLDSHPEVKRPHWFGFVDTKDCKGCGQGCTKHKPGECDTCKAQLVVFTKAAGAEIGRACEKCQPEEHARLLKEVEEKAADPMEARMAKMEAMMSAMDARCKKMEDAMDAMADAMKSMTDTFKNLDPLLTTLPPEPEGGGKGKEGDPNNPPEKKTPPRLVIVREEESPEAKARAAVLAIAKEAVGEVCRQEIDRMKGRVP
jgi:hypothetical protein